MRFPARLRQGRRPWCWVGYCLLVKLPVSASARMVRVLGQMRRNGREPVGESGDGLPGDCEVFEVGLCLPQSSLE
ncbi:hypothetical protein Shyhy02_58700 [Streptomyces hygroscopicus subsp. hygroscopicus]|nr:hypothetical protein Shyhy02_58700 [Streptomyces hygroscopicus subsp. hygroscopicus]